MADKTVTWTSYDKLVCSECLPADVYLCLKDGILPAPQVAVKGSLIAMQVQPNLCGDPLYIYSVSYDETLIPNDYTLACGDVNSLLCDSCLTKFISQNGTLTVAADSGSSEPVATGQTLSIRGSGAAQTSLTVVPMLASAEEPLKTGTPAGVVVDVAVPLNPNGPTLPVNALSIEAGGLFTDANYSIQTDTGLVTLHPGFNPASNAGIQVDVRVDTAPGNALTIVPFQDYGPPLYFHGGLRVDANSLAAIGCCGGGGTVVVVSADVGNVLRTGSDGGGYFNGGDILPLLPPQNIVVGADGGTPVTLPLGQAITVQGTNPLEGIVSSQPYGAKVLMDLKLSADAGNALSVHADGLYSAAGGGTVVVVSADVGNVLRVGSDGGGYFNGGDILPLLPPQNIVVGADGGTPVTISLGQAITVQGMNPLEGIVSAQPFGAEVLMDLKLSADAGNGLSVHADGLYAAAGGGGGGVSRFAQVIYVDQHAGNDTTGDGSLTHPYATIAKALSVVPTSGLSLTNSYAIQLGAGAYIETAVALRPFVHIVGMGYLASRINVPGGNITLDTSSGMFSGNARVGLYSLSLSGSTGINFDTSALPNASLVLDGRNCWVSGAVTLKGRAYGADYAELYGFGFFNDFTVTDFQGELETSFVTGTVHVNCQAYSSGGDTEFDLSFVRASGLSVVSDNSRNQKMTLFSTQIPSLSAAGANIALTLDAESFPASDSIALSGGAALIKNKVFPRNVSVPSSSTAPGLVGDYAVDATYRYECIAANTWVRVPVSTF